MECDAIKNLYNLAITSFQYICDMVTIPSSILHYRYCFIRMFKDDLIDFDKHIQSNAELIVCMTDTLIHLDSRDRVVYLFEKVMASLEKSGRFIITFRDLSHELSELDRFIPVNSDDNTIFTCFLEYEPETVKVHDLVYRKKNGDWFLNKSFYRKLRLSKEWVNENFHYSGP